LGAVFFLISALLAPFSELIRTMRGRSSRARWASVAMQLMLAVAMISVAGALLGLVGLVSGAGLVQGLSSFSLLPLTVTTAILVFVLVSAKLVQLHSRGARRGTRANFERRLLEPLSNTQLALAETSFALFGGADVAALWRIRRRAGFYPPSRTSRAGEGTIRESRPGRSGCRGLSG
jgi:hypothetical protein